MMDDHPDLRDLGGPVPYMEVRPHRDQLYKAITGLINTVTLVVFAASIPLIVMLFRAAF